MRVLVTGGSGFIGSHVVDRLLVHGHEPRIFDLLPSRHHAAGEVETLLGDLTDPDSVARAVAGCAAVVHLAAVADVNEVVRDPARADAVNVRGTQTLLDAVRKQEVSRFLYASTVWVYGDAPAEPPLDEDCALALPAHLYTATKLAGEMYARSYHALYGVPAATLRFGIPYGPRSREAAVVAAFVERAFAGRALTIAGDGRQSRQFVYVEDLADGCVAALADGRPGRVYNLVGDESTSVREIADTVRRLVGNVPIVHGQPRPADVTIETVSGRRAESELGWRATTSFAEGVRRYVDWLAVTSGAPVSRAASMIAGNAAAVTAHEPSEL